MHLFLTFVLWHDNLAYILNLKRTDTLFGVQLSNSVSIPFRKGSTLKGKQQQKQKQHVFLLKETMYSEGVLMCSKVKQEATKDKIIFLVHMAENIPGVSSHFKYNKSSASNSLLL